MIRTQVNPPLTDSLIEDVVALWTAAANHGEAVGFAPPVGAEQVARAVAVHWDRVIDGVSDLIVAFDEDVLVGFALLARSQEGPAAAHRGRLETLQRAADHAGTGIGSVLLDAVRAQAESHGIGRLTLTMREGTGAERFYLRNGFRQVARLPDWVRIGGRPIAALVLTADLSVEPGGAAAAPGVAAGEPVDTPVGGVVVPVLRLDPDLPLPRYAQPGDAGLDLHARVHRILPPGTRTVMPTGIAVAIPPGYVGLVHPRSGSAVRDGLSIVNSPGTIDAGYRGEIKVPLINHDPSAKIVLHRGDRVAQLLLQRVEHAVLHEVDTLPDGSRGAEGFGSTGR